MVSRQIIPSLWHSKVITRLRQMAHFCRYENSLSTDVSWQQSGGRCRCMPPGHTTSDMEDTTEDEEVQRDPRASSTSLLEEAQVGYALSFPFVSTDLYFSVTIILDLK